MAYSIAAFGEMIGDAVRTDAYARALAAVVEPDSVVLDIGTGTGILSLLACRCGARKVFAVESSDAIHVAREIAAANGYAGRIEFIQGMSTDLSLPEAVDVVVSDLHGVLPLYKRNLVAVADARRRFLKPGGAIIPGRETLWIAAVEATEQYRRITGPWADNAYGLDMSAARRLEVNVFRREVFTPRDLLTSPQCCATLDYATLESPDVRMGARLAVTSAGIAHGLSMWFDSSLYADIGFSNRPGEAQLVFGNAFFPWLEPVPLAVGDLVLVDLRADLIGDDYMWSWDTRVLAGAGADAPKARFSQSHFFGATLSRDRLKKQAGNHTPRLGEEGRIDSLVLALMDGRATLGEIAQKVCERFPHRFSRWQDALPRVAEVSIRYDE